MAGHPLASSETFTWLREHLRESPSQMKPEVDQLLLTGINHIFYHGTAYSSVDAPWPGWLFYASTEANPRNPLRGELSGLNGYTARCQAALQAGDPDNDVLLYWPLDDLWQREKGLTRGLGMHSNDWLAPTPAGKVATELVDAGYAFDFVSDRQIQQTRWADGALKTEGGTTYRTVLVPPTAHMAHATLRRCLDLASDGATVLFVEALPADVPGYGKLAERRAQLKEQIDRVKWQAGDAAADPAGDAAGVPAGIRSAGLGRGRVMTGDSASALLAAARGPAASRSPAWAWGSSAAACPTAISTSSPTCPRTRSAGGRSSAAPRGP